MWFIVLLTSLTVALAAEALRRWMRVRRYWAERGVPHEAPHPLMGSLTFLQRRNFTEWIMEKYEHFKPAPYFGVWFFWRPVLVVNCPEIARRVLVKDADIFRDRLVSSGTSDAVGALNVFTVNDPLWSFVRKRLTGMFTTSRLKSFEQLKKTKAEELVARIRKEQASNKFIDLRDVYSCFTTDVIGAAAFGVSGDATSTNESPMRTVTKHFMKYNLWRGLAWSSMFFLPELTDVFGFSMFPKESTKYFRKIYATLVQQRSGKVSGHKDLMDSLLKIKREAEAEGDNRITDDVLIAQAAIFLQAGFDTTAVSMSYLTYELAHNPKIQERLYIEVSAMYKEKGINYESVNGMEYMNACIKEILRKYPALGFLDRVASTAYKIDDKLTISKGTTVYINSMGMHYDSDYFPDPLVFNPDRFLPENEKNIKPFTYLPFGEGPRNCVGLRFGHQAMLYSMSHLVLAFEFRPVAGLPHPEDLKCYPRSILLSPDRPLTVQFINRKAN